MNFKVRNSRVHFSDYPTFTYERNYCVIELIDLDKVKFRGSHEGAPAYEHVTTLHAIHCIPKSTLA